MQDDWEPKIKSKPDILPLFIRRIEKDIKDITKKPPAGIFALPDEHNVRIMRVMITGPSGTPYHGGGNTVRFNPNIYANGKVCLSILGTWDGPGWSPSINLSSVLVSMQSLLNDEPYRNEPGHENASADKVKEYNDLIQHETIKYAVIDVMEKIDTYHEYFVGKIKTIFNQNYDHYLKVCNDNMHFDGKPFTDSFVRQRGMIQYKVLLEKLQKLKPKNEFNDTRDGNRLQLI